MKSWRIIIVAVIVGFIIWSLYDIDFDDQNLGKGYYYLPAYEAEDVGYPGGAIIYKSPHKYLYSRSLKT